MGKGSEVYGFACIYPAILYEHTAARILLDLNTNLCYIPILAGTMIHDKRLGLVLGYLAAGTLLDNRPVADVSNHVHCNTRY